MRTEEAYEDVLRSLESSIVAIYWEQPDLLDKEVDAALNVLITEYNGELLNKSRHGATLSNKPLRVYESLKNMSEWCMGRGELTEDISRHAIEFEESVDVREILRCLKRIRKSVKFWTKKAGRQGYLRYVDQYF